MRDEYQSFSGVTLSIQDGLSIIQQLILYSGVLTESDEPQKSFKVGRVVVGGAARTGAYLVTLVIALLVHGLFQL